MVDLRELAQRLRVEEQPGVAPVGLLPPPCQPSDPGRVAGEHPVAESLREFDEPGAVAAGLNPNASTLYRQKADI